MLESLFGGLHRGYRVFPRMLEVSGFLRVLSICTELGLLDSRQVPMPQCFGSPAPIAEPIGQVFNINRTSKTERPNVHVLGEVFHCGARLSPLN